MKRGLRFGIASRDGTEWYTQVFERNFGRYTIELLAVSEEKLVGVKKRRKYKYMAFSYSQILELCDIHL